MRGELTTVKPEQLAGRRAGVVEPGLLISWATDLIVADAADPRHLRCDRTSPTTEV